MVDRRTVIHVVDVMASPEAVARLWQELTGNALSRERTAEFLQRDEVGELAQFSERRLRRAAKQVPQASWLLLSAWLSAARDVSVEPTHGGTTSTSPTRAGCSIHIQAGQPTAACTVG